MGATVIKRSRRKLALLLFSPCVFVVGGYCLFVRAQAIAASIGVSFVFVRSLGLAAVVVGVLGAFIIVRMLLDNAPGLVLDDRGVTDNSTIFPAGFVPWSNISSFEPARMGQVAIVYVVLRDPKQYIASRGAFMRALLSATSWLYTSPVAIRPSTLQVRFQELLPLMNSHLSGQGQNA
jgi:hypothetical protein